MRSELGAYGRARDRCPATAPGSKALTVIGASEALEPPDVDAGPSCRRTRRSEVGWGTILGEFALGAAIGVVVPYAALRLERTRFFDLAESYEPLYAFAVGLLVLALASVTHANLFLAAFSAGVTTATVSPRFKEAFHEFGELLIELLKPAAILVFGTYGGT